MNVLTTNVIAYPLPESLADRLVRIDTAAQSMARSGASVPASVALGADDFDTIDTIVRAVSGGQRTATSVTLSGRPLSRLVA